MKFFKGNVYTSVLEEAVQKPRNSIQHSDILCCECAQIVVFLHRSLFGCCENILNTSVLVLFWGSESEKHHKPRRFACTSQSLGTFLNMTFCI